LEQIHKTFPDKTSLDQEWLAGPSRRASLAVTTEPAGSSLGNTTASSEPPFVASANGEAVAEDDGLSALGSSPSILRPGLTGNTGNQHPKPSLGFQAGERASKSPVDPLKTPGEISASPSQGEAECFSVCIRKVPGISIFKDSYSFSCTLRLIFNIQLVNKNRQLLHNLTLGYNIYDNYLSPFRTSHALLDLLSTGEANVPNYGCGRKENLLALFDAAQREISSQMSTLADTYKVPQISDNIVSEALSDKSKFPFFHQMLPREGFHYPAIVQLLLHFRWTLIGLFASDTEKGENFMKIFTLMLVRSGICAVISQRLSTTGYTAASLREALSKWRQVNVFVHFIEYESVRDRALPFHETLMHLPGPIEEKVWIVTVLGTSALKKHRVYKYIHSIWSFAFLGKERPKDAGFEPYFFVEHQFEDHYFHCSLSKHVFSVKGRRRCTQEAPLDTQWKWDRRRITNFHLFYSFIQTLAQALNAAYSSRSRRGKEGGRREVGGSKAAAVAVPSFPAEE
ncbi:vomeronasal type-2 receptor 26-like, partial [Ahaetulla prasina]|uniref:vomeronasal type-2 receptor 26-like n=1 Tax=Ahaetulla prasina TaxID=499056 RepID=UPI00264729D5